MSAPSEVRVSGSPSGERGVVRQPDPTESGMTRLLASHDQDEINECFARAIKESRERVRDLEQDMEAGASRVRGLEQDNVRLRDQLTELDKQVRRNAAAAIDAANGIAECKARDEEENSILGLMTGGATVGGLGGFPILGGVAGLGVSGIQRVFRGERQSLIPYGVSEQELVEYQISNPGLTRETALRQIFSAKGQQMTDHQIAQYRQAHPKATEETAIREVAREITIEQIKEYQRKHRLDQEDSGPDRPGYGGDGDCPDYDPSVGDGDASCDYSFSW